MFFRNKVNPDNGIISSQILKSHCLLRTENPPQSLLSEHHFLQSVQSELTEANVWRRLVSEHLLLEWDVNETSTTNNETQLVVQVVLIPTSCQQEDLKICVHVMLLLIKNDYHTHLRSSSVNILDTRLLGNEENIPGNHLPGISVHVSHLSPW